MAGEPRGLGRNIAAAFGGEVIQALLGVAIFFGLFIQLSDREWGLYVAVTTTGLIIGTIANLGSQEILVRNVARGSDLAAEWGQTLTTQLVGGLVGLAVGLALRPVIYPEIPFGTTAVLLLFNISLFWLVETTVRVGQSTHHLAIGARGRLSYAVSRLAGVGAFAASGADDLTSFAMFAFPLATLGTFAALAQTVRATQTRPKFGLPPIERLTRGFPFVGTAGAQDLLAGFDRPLLSANGFVVETGQYGIADRIARLASIPTLAVVRATAADFFTTGEHDGPTTFRLAVRYARPVMIYGVAASIGLAATALIAQNFVPDRFVDVMPMIAALAALAALHATQLFPANVLTGTDRQSTRLVLYATAAGLNICLNLLWIPERGWRGAAAATLIAEASLAAMLWIAARRVTR